MENKQDAHGHITKDFKDNRELLERQINKLEIKQRDIQSHIATIEANITSIDMLLQAETVAQKQMNYRGAISKNIELLTKLYSVYKEYSDCKHKYFNNITDMTYRLHHMIEIDIRRIDDKIGGIGDGDAMEVLKTFTQIAQGLTTNQSQLPEGFEIDEPECKL